MGCVDSAVRRKVLVISIMGEFPGRGAWVDGAAASFNKLLREYFKCKQDLEQKTFHVQEFFSYSEILTPNGWFRLRQYIVESVKCGGYGSILILHRAETIVYSSAAMSFHLVGVPAVVVFTGSILPFESEGKELWRNIEGASLALAGQLSDGVYLYFCDELLLPVRCSMVRSFGRQIFAERGLSQPELDRPAFSVQINCRAPGVSASVVALPIFPGVSIKQIQCFVDVDCGALILEFSSVSLMQDFSVELFELLDQAYRRKVIVVAITSFYESAIYDSNNVLQGAGVISGGDMTREAIFGKLHVLLSADLDFEQIRSLIKVDMCGELT